jgi:hypothetical protein
MEVTEVFMTFAITSGIGLILAIGKLCYKSKCKEVNVCCIKIVRDVEGEEKIDIEIPQTPRNETKNND